MTSLNDSSLRFPALCLLAVAIAHVLVSPFTKVEESWTLHAVHDFLKLGAQWDHVANPGPVPRSFLGPAWLSALAAPTSALWPHAPGDSLDVQIIVRMTLATVNIASIYDLARRAKLRLGSAIARRLLLLTAAQFHLVFWCSRTLPNMTAFPFGALALGRILFPSSGHDALTGIALLTATAAVLRAELVALLLPLTAQALFRKAVKLHETFVTGVVAGLTAVGLAIPFDSYFWQRWPVWAELQGIHFNVVHGKSADWGTSPWHAYFSRSLPKLLHIWLIPALYAYATDRRARHVALPAIVFVGLLSYLGHKEWRFVVYVVPLFNLAALVGEDKTRGPLKRFCRRCYVPAIPLFSLAILATATLTALMTTASHFNYPGGDAMQQLTRLAQYEPRRVAVHVDAYSAMTGASLFTHSEHVRVNKSETLSSAADFRAFDFLLSHQPERHADDFEVVSQAYAFAGLRRQKSSRSGSLLERLPISPAFAPAVYLMRRR